MRTHILTGTLTLFCALELCTGCAEPGQTEIARGNVLASRKQFGEAIEAYRAAAQAAPGKAYPRELLGHLLFDLGRRTEARAAYEDAIRADVRGALEARIGLARLDADEHNFDRALDRLNQLLEQQPNNLYALLSRASVALRRGRPGDPESAIADTAKAMTIDPKNSAVLYLRGSSFLAAKQFNEADAAFRLLERAHSKLPLAWYGYARLASARGDRTGALANLRIAREKAHHQPDGWNGSAISADPTLQFLKDDPEFAAVVRGSL